MRAHIKQHANGAVTLTDDDPLTGNRRTTFYFAQAGTVKIATHAHRIVEPVCERLSNRGWTLQATPETLLKVIRREHRKALAWRKKQERDL